MSQRTCVVIGKKRHRHTESCRELRQPSGTDPIPTFLVLVELLKRNPDPLGKDLLPLASTQAFSGGAERLPRHAGQPPTVHYAGTYPQVASVYSSRLWTIA
jgi:hypothetical protein